MITYNEPWTQGTHHDRPAAISDACEVIVTGRRTANGGEADIRRINACVNVLEGVSVRALEAIAERFPNDRGARIRYLVGALREGPESELLEAIGENMQAARYLSESA